MLLENNIVLDTDAYKLPHFSLRPAGITSMYSYGESRGGRYPHTIFTGLNPILQDHFVGNVVNDSKIAEGVREAKAYFGTDNTSYFNRSMWEYIAKIHHGKLPVEIKAVPEGSKVPTGNVLFTVTETDARCAELVQPLETLLMHVWYPTTVATQSYEIRKIILAALIKSGTPESIEFKCHDFGYRGTTCQQQAARGAMANMLVFRGSDTLVGDRAIKAYYGTKEDSILKTVLATEHSVATFFGPGQGELAYFAHFLDTLPKNKIGSIVIDSYDWENFVKEVACKPENVILVKERAEHGGAVVLRPDSGDPKQVTLKMLDILAASYGYSYIKGYKVLHPSIRIIYGDGMTPKTIEELYECIMTNGWSADNLVVGSGGGLLQRDLDRDTQRFAIKASFARQTVNGSSNIVLLSKKPISDPGKNSKEGELKLIPTGINNSFRTISSVGNTQAVFSGYHDSLVTVFKNGELVNRESFDTMRNRVASY